MIYNKYVFGVYPVPDTEFLRPLTFPKWRDEGFVIHSKGSFNHIWVNEMTLGKTPKDEGLVVNLGLSVPPHLWGGRDAEGWINH